MVMPEARGGDRWNSFRIRTGQKGVTYFRKKKFPVITGDKNKSERSSLPLKNPRLTLKEQGKESL